jgi:transcriptional regulator with XRE-family HTH domain
MTEAMLLDQIKASFELKNDSDLSTFLGVTRASIHNIRFDESRRLGQKSRFFLIDRIAYLKNVNTTGHWIKVVSTQYLAERLQVDDALQGKITTERDLIELAKTSLNCKTDDDLAEILGLARNTISALRFGKSSLGLLPRLKLLNHVEKFPLDQVIELLDSSEKLSLEIRIWKSRSVL